MAVTLTVSQVRQALDQAGGQPGDGSPSTASIGTLFHRVLSELLRPDSPWNVENAVRELDPDLVLWKRMLKRHTYDQLVGPLLTQQSAALQSHGDKVQCLWIATQDACDLLSELWWEITEHGKQAAEQRHWFFAEQQVIREVNQPGWREPVAILGQADAVLRVPGQNHWCVLEWKLGRTTPDVDLGQACLYHMILESLSDSAGNSALALVSFRPQRNEALFEQQRLATAKQRLIDLIGRLAGVAGLASNGREPASDAGDRNPPKPTTATTPPPEWTAELNEKLLRALRQSGAPCREARPVIVGPTFARFFVQPERGVTVRKVQSQSEQLHLALGLNSPPNIAIIEGSIGIDLPRPVRTSIPFSEAARHLPQPDPLTGCSKVPVGVDLNGRWQLCDLSASESAHLLVVGTPGSGKTQWLRSSVAALIKTNTRETLELLLIDPKQNAFQFAKSSPFLREPIVVPDMFDGITDTLDELLAEMARRNRLFAQANCQDLAQYVRHAGAPLPRIVCCCDEYADLLLQADRTERSAIEKSLKRLAGVGRSAGIHLILATQQPRRDIVTPAIRSLIGARVALRVSSPLESRVALAENGAECLMGDGDLLYQCIGAPLRLQGAWLPEAEESLVGTTPTHSASLN